MQKIRIFSASLVAGSTLPGMFDRLTQTARRQAAVVALVAMVLGVLGGCVGARSEARDAGPARQASAAVQPAADGFVNDDALIAAAARFIEPFEGRRHRVYEDSMGNLTIGVGFNLDRPGAAEDLAKLLPGVSYRGLRRGTVRLTDAQIDTLLRHDAARALESARRHVENFDELPRQAQLILVDMSFNLGSLRGWPGLQAAVEAGDFATAADEMHDSRWREQTGHRAQHLIALMQSLATPQG